MVTKFLPWRGEEVKAKLLAEHKAGIRALAYYVADVARRLVPVDTGELRDSIQVISEADGMRLYVIATAKHAEPQEFGFRMRNGGFYPPQAYMRRALNDGAMALPQFVGRSRVAQGYHAGKLMGATFE